MEDKSTHSEVPTNQQQGTTQSTQISYQSLVSENVELKSDNQRLKQQLQIVQQRVRRQLQQQKAKAESEQEVRFRAQLEESEKQLQQAKRQINNLSKRVHQNPEQSFQKLKEMLRDKDQEIKQLRKQIGNLKRNSRQLQQRLLLVENGEASNCFDNYQQLLDDYGRLLKRCAAYQSQLTQTKPTPRLVERHSSVHIACLVKYEREIQALRNAGARSKRTSNYLRRELTKLRQQNAQLHDRVNGMDYQLQRSKNQVSQYRRRMSSLVVHKPHVKQSKRYKPLTLSAEYPTTPPSQHRVHLPSIELKPAYPKIEFAGHTIPNSSCWNDLEYSSKIKAIIVSLNTDGTIGQIDCIYEHGSTNRISQSASAQAFKCEHQQYISGIAGGFRNDILNYLSVWASSGQMLQFGVRSKDCRSFEFAIGNQECPVSLFGETITVGENQYINKIGCFIQLL